MDAVRDLAIKGEMGALAPRDVIIKSFLLMSASLHMRDHGVSFYLTVRRQSAVILSRLSILSVGNVTTNKTEQANIKFFI